MENEQQLRYRPEIDGLRAIAVLLVVLNHLDFLGLTGGFIGVDVFFVISGFLISQILISRPIDKNTLRKFYIRRIRRILPLLILVLIANSILVFYVFLPNEIESYSKSQIATVLFGSNFYFMSSQGYFDLSALSQPLLHTWSLGVEEQFYLLFPLILAGILKIKLKGRWPSLILIAASITLSEFMLGNKSPSAFYATYTRAWELIVGVIGGIWIFRSKEIRISLLPRKVLSYLSISIIFLCAIFFDTNSRVPGLLTLLPTLSTLTLLIVLDKNTIFIFRLLTSKLAVYLGKISFGVYLWHWPLLVFYQYGQISNLSSFERFCILVMSICLASASNRFIEIPARSSLRISDKRILLITTAGITVTIVFSILGIVSGGFESYKTQTMTESNLMRYRAEKVDWVDNNKCIFNSVSFTSEEFLERMEGCHKRLGKAVVLLGDSHGQEIFNALALNLGDQFLLGVTRGGCRPHSPSEECQYKEFLTFQKTHQKMIKAVIFHQAGFYLLSDSSGGDGDRSLFSTIARVKGMPVYPVNFNFVSKNLDYLKLLDRTIPVIWLGPYIEPHYNVIDLVSHSQSCSQDIYDIPENQIRTFQNLDRELGNVLPKRSNVTYLSLMSALNFRWDKDLYDCETVFWADGDHWSPDGEARFGTRIQNLLNTKRLFL